MKIKLLVAAVILAVASSPAYSKELELNGVASVNASGDPQSVRSVALREAKRNAIIAGINKINGPDSAKDPKVAEKLQAIVDQIKDSYITDNKGQKLGDQYEMRVTIIMDDKEFRTLILDAGIAANTTTTRSSSILVMMDEFFTNPTDLKAPLEELEEFSSEKGKSSKDKTISAKSSKQSDAKSSASASSLDAQASATAKASESHDSQLAASGKTSAAGSARDQNSSASLAASNSASLSAKDKGQSTAEASASASLKESKANSESNASAASASSATAKNVASEEHDNVHYKKLVKYQPQNRGPEKTSQAYSALMGQLQDYDIKVLDNVMFKSKYFKNKPITIEEMENSAQFSKYIDFAKKDANADFFMVGNSIIIDAGKNQATGENKCTGVVTVKTFSTVSGESISSDTFSESAAGMTVNDCAANLSKKLASFGGPIIGARIQEYWKRRSTYGKEYIVNLVGNSLPLMTRIAFAKGIKSIEGVEKDVQRASSDKLYQMVVTYKGSDPLEQAIAMGLSSNPQFATLDAMTEADKITMCMGPCPLASGKNETKEKPAAPPQAKKKK